MKIKKIFGSEIKSIDAAEGTLTAYITTNARDRMDEVVDPNGVDLKNYRKNPVVLFAHDYNSQPIGKALWTKKDDNGIIAKVKFASTAFAQEIFTLFKEGVMNAFSIGFIPKEWVDGDGQKKARRTYTKSEMLEFSAVPVPANPEALAMAMKSGLITDITKKFFEETKDPDEGNQDDDGTDEGNQDDEKEETKIDVDDKGFDDLTGEIILLNDTIDALQKQLAESNEELAILKFKLLKKEHKPAERLVSEMTGEELAEKMGDVFSGVIRTITGKV